MGTVNMQRENAVAMVATTSASLIEGAPILRSAFGRVSNGIGMLSLNRQIANTRARIDDLHVEYQKIAIADQVVTSAAGKAAHTIGLNPNGATAQLEELKTRRTQLQNRMSTTTELGVLNPLAVGISIGGAALHGWAAYANAERGNNTAAWANGMAATGHGMVVVGKIAEAMEAGRAASRFGRAGMALAAVAGVAAIIAARD